jgi:hypothetical protein
MAGCRQKEQDIEYKNTSLSFKERGILLQFQEEMATNCLLGP